MSIIDKFLDAIRLNDDFEDDEDFFDEEDEITDAEKPKHRFFKKLEDTYDDDDDNDDASETLEGKSAAEKEKAPKKNPFTEKFFKSEKADKQPSSKNTSSKITPMRNRKSNNQGSMEVCVIKPTNMEDAREIADTLLDRCTVILNLEGIDVEMAQRIIDFSCGCCYAISGNLQKVSSYIFILTPANVEITGDFQEILSGTFDVPYVRTSY